MLGLFCTISLPLTLDPISMGASHPDPVAVCALPSLVWSGLLSGGLHSSLSLLLHLLGPWQEGDCAWFLSLSFYLLFLLFAWICLPSDVPALCLRRVCVLSRESFVVQLVVTSRGETWRSSQTTMLLTSLFQF